MTIAQRPIASIEQVDGLARRVAPFWRDDREFDAIYPVASCAIGDWLFGVPRQVMTMGLVAFNGSTLRSAATYPVTMTNYANIYTDGTSLFAVATAPVVTLTGTLTGTLTQGELLTQAISGATGYFVRTSGDTHILLYVSGTFDTSNDVAGASGAIAITNAVKATNQQFLLRSSDGFAPFVAVRELRGGAVSPLARSFCAAGSTLLYFDYSAEPSVYASSDGLDWQELFQATDVDGVKPVAHFHGAVYLSGLGRLLVMTGDDSRSEAAGGYTATSLLLCDDVADLVANPATWKSRWALDVAGDDRHEALVGSSYCFGVGSQAFRTVDLIADEDESYVYWIPDQSSSDYGYLGETAPVNYLWRASMTTLATERLGGRVVGVGWYGCRVGAVVLISTTSARASGSYIPNCDEYQRVYAASASGAVEVRRWRRSDYAAPTTATFNNVTMMSAKGRAWLWSDVALWENNRYHNGCVGSVGYGDQPDNDDLHFISNARNLAPNGRALEADVSKYVGGYAVVSQDASVFDSERGQLYSIKVLPDGTALKPCQAYLAIPATWRRALLGNYITLSCRAYVPADTPAAQTPAIRIQGSAGADAITYIPMTGRWEDVQATVFIPTSAVQTSLIMRFYANWSAANTGTHPIYLSDIRVNIGAVPLLPNTPSSDIFLTAV